MILGEKRRVSPYHGESGDTVLNIAMARSDTASNDGDVLAGVGVLEIGSILDVSSLVVPPFSS
jgi:hypothetical protein